METDGQEVKKSGRRKGGRATINREVVQSVVHTFNTVVVVSSWAVRPKFGRSVGPLYFVSGASTFVLPNVFACANIWRGERKSMPKIEARARTCPPTNLCQGDNGSEKANAEADRYGRFR